MNTLEPNSYGFLQDKITENLSYFLTDLFGGATWSRTKNVYPEGSDLQSEDAHAIASIAP